MTHTGILTRIEIETMGPPVLEELRRGGRAREPFCAIWP